MPRDIFSDVAHPRGAQPRAWYTLPLSILAHAALVALVIVIPLMATDMLPSPPSRVPDYVMTAPTPPPPPDARPRGASRQQTSAATAPNDNAAPIKPADDIGKPEDYVPLVPSLDAGPPGPPVATESFGVGHATVLPPPPPAPKDVKPMRPGGAIRYPQKIRDARPIYPQIAVSAKVEGRVLIEAIIAIDGTVRDARVTKSVPLLDQAALDAVRQWRFTPSTLNGVPVPVILTITVDFKLQ